MASWYSNLLTKTSSQISSIRQNLLSSESDGDTEDDTHVCRVLRSYYSEKGRPFPSWLPPDPKAPTPTVSPAAGASPLYATTSSSSGGGGGGGSSQQRPPLQGGLSSLWDTVGAATQQHQQQQQQQNQVPASLRAGRGGGNGVMQRSNSGFSSSDEPQARPLPSQRAGSHQGGASSAQDRLKQRLWGAASRGASPQQSAPFQPPPSASGGGGGNYDDRYAPGGAYDSGRGGGDDRGGRRGPGLPSGPRGYR